jgi:2-polyprenyl-3-methyl-5-hydroxy-6-metoxy-1,4-benzoquinol methylase
MILFNKNGNFNPLSNESTSSIQKVYDEVASTYHLLWKDWDGLIQSQKVVFENVFSNLGLKGKLRVLDCGCGIGTQSIAMGLLKHEVLGIDISKASIDRARHETKKLNLDASFEQENILNLKNLKKGKFDVIICAGNVIGHLLSEDDLILFLEGVKSCLKENGHVLIGFKKITPAIYFRLPFVIKQIFFRNRQLRFTIVRRKWSNRIYQLQYWFITYSGLKVHREVRNGYYMRSWSTKELVQYSKNIFFNIQPKLYKDKKDKYYQNLLIF